MKSLILLFVSLVVVLSSCNFGDPSPGEELALGLDEQGRFIVAFRGCKQVSITRLKVLAVHGSVIGDSDDEILWEIKSDGSQQDVFTTGILPDGFIEVTRHIPPEFTKGSFGAQLYKGTSYRPASLDIDGVNLRRGKVRDIDRDYLTLDQFRNKNTCG